MHLGVSILIANAYIRQIVTNDTYHDYTDHERDNNEKELRDQQLRETILQSLPRKK